MMGQLDGYFAQLVLLVVVDVRVFAFLGGLSTAVDGVLVVADAHMVEITLAVEAVVFADEWLV